MNTTPETPEALAAMIDQTLLKPETLPSQVAALCEEARKYAFGAVCINPCHVPLAVEMLEDTPVKVCTVAGFPLGADQARIKADAADLAIQQGAREIDMVLAVGLLKAGEYPRVRDDIAAVAGRCHNAQALLKVILETGLLTDDEKRKACALCIEAGADFVKTSTGMNAGGATVEDVALMAEAVRDAGLGVKASGGIRTYDDAVRMIRAGATRIGTSGGVAIMEEAWKRNSKS